MQRINPKYGNFYWYLSGSDFDCHVVGDKLVIDSNGNALFYRDEDHVNFVVKANKWDRIEAASQLDGSAVAVEHWQPKRKDTANARN